MIVMIVAKELKTENERTSLLMLPLPAPAPAPAVCPCLLRCSLFRRQQIVVPGLAVMIVERS